MSSGGYGGMEIEIEIGGGEIGLIEIGTSGEGERGGVSPRNDSSESEPSSFESLEEEARMSFRLGWVFLFFGGGDWAAFVGFLFLGEGPFTPLTTILSFPYSGFLPLGAGLSVSWID